MGRISSQKRKNYIINGDMQIAQRGTSFAAAVNTQYVVDRFQYSKVGTMVHTASQDTDVPTLAQSGYLFKNSLRLNLTTPDTSIAAGDICTIRQYVEGYNFSNLAQKSFTLSFWVKATITGIYCVAFGNSGADRSYVAEYTINSSNTWEYKTITVSASPSAGTWNYTNGNGLRVLWTIASGTTYQTTAGSWQTGDFIATSNQVNGTNTGATDFRIAGVMLNEGFNAQPFRTFGESFDAEIAACQRYYKRYDEIGFLGTGVIRSGTTASCFVPFKVQMRASPTFSTNTTTASDLAGVDSGGSNNNMQVSLSTSTTNGANTLWTNGAATMTVGQGAMGIIKPGGYIAFDSEL